MISLLRLFLYSLHTLSHRCVGHTLDGLGVLFDMRNGEFCVGCSWRRPTVACWDVRWAYRSAVLTVDVTFVRS